MVGRAPRYAQQDSWAPRYAWQYVCCMVCGMMGELTKLCAYGFQFWFQVPLHRRGRSWHGSSASHTHDFRILRSMGLHYDMITIDDMIFKTCDYGFTVLYDIDDVF